MTPSEMLDFADTVSDKERLLETRNYFRERLAVLDRLCAVLAPQANPDGGPPEACGQAQTNGHSKTRQKQQTERRGASTATPVEEKAILPIGLTEKVPDDFVMPAVFTTEPVDNATALQTVEDCPSAAVPIHRTEPQAELRTPPNIVRVRRTVIARYIAQHGPRTVTELAAQFNVKEWQVKEYIKHAWFEIEGGKVTVSNVGRNEAWPEKAKQEV